MMMMIIPAYYTICTGFFQQNPIAWPLSSFCVTWRENLEYSITPSWTWVPASHVCVYRLFKCSFV